MRRAAIIACVAFAYLVAYAQPVSYWFQGFQRQPTAQRAQEYFFVPGTNVVFTYDTNHVIISAAGAGGPFDPLGSAHDATNGFPWLSLSDPSGSAHDATNGFPWGVLYDPAGTGTTAAHNSTNGYPWTNIFSPGVSGGLTNQVYTQTGWSGYPQLTNLSLTTNKVGTDIVPSLWLTNPTPSSLGAQQYSPALGLMGHGWRSGNSTDHTLAMGFYILPTQGSSADPTAQLTIFKSVDGAAPSSTGIQFNSINGGANFGGTIAVSGDVQASTFSSHSFLTRSKIFSPANSDIQLVNNASTAFSRLYLGLVNGSWTAIKIESTNAPTISIRTGDDVNYASTVASNLTALKFVTASNGMIISSNSWMSCPTLTYGQNFYCSSNGVPHVIWMNESGTLTTNRLVP